MANFIAAGIVILCVGGAIAYIVKAKKKGVKCIGCPAAGQCAKKHSSNGNNGCSCCGH